MALQSAQAARRVRSGKPAWYRRKVLGILLILLVAYYLVVSVFGIFVGAGMATGTDPLQFFSIGFITVSVVTGTLLNALWGTLAPSLYVDLRNAKEGGGLDNLQDVFG